MYRTLFIEESCRTGENNLLHVPDFCCFYPIATAGGSLITGIKAIAENATANQTLNNINEFGKVPRMQFELNGGEMTIFHQGAWNQTWQARELAAHGISMSKMTLCTKSYSFQYKTAPHIHKSHMGQPSLRMYLFRIPKCLH